MASRSILYVVLAMFGFGMMALFTREANASVITIATWRAIIVAVIFGVAAFWKKELHNITTKEHLKISIPYGLFLGLASSTFVGGYAFTTVANTIFLHNLAPLFAIPLALWMFSEKAHPNLIAGALICLIGVGLISGVSLFHASHFTNSRFLLGDFLAAVSAFGYAGVLVWTKMTRKAELPVLGTLFVAWSVAAIVLIGMAGVLGSLAISWSGFLWILGLAFFCTNLPFYFLNIGMKQVSAGMASVLSMSEVLFATLLGILIYQENLAPIGWVGGVLVVLGVIYPFLPEGDASEKKESTLPEKWHQTRQYRTFFWLFSVNTAAFLFAYEGSSIILVLCFIQLIQIGSPALERLLDYRFPRYQKMVSGFLSLAILYILINNHFSIPSLSPFFVADICILIILDHMFQQKESTILKEQGIEKPIEGDIRIILAALLLAACCSAIEHQAQYILIWSTFILGGAIALGKAMLSFRNDEQSRLLSFIRFPKLQWSIVGIVALFMMGGIYQVPTGHRALVERFGHFVFIQDAGLLMRLPPPIEHVDIFDSEKIFSHDIWKTEQNLLCGDQSMLSVQASLHFTIQDPKKYRYQAFVPEDLLVQRARALIINNIRQLSHEDLLHNRGDFALSWKEQLQALSDQNQLGFKILSLDFTYISVPPAVRDSFLDVLSAIEDQNTEINRAKAYASSALPQSLGEAIVMHEKSLADAASIEAESMIWIQKAQALHDGGSTQPYLLLDWVKQEQYSLYPLNNPIVRDAQYNVFIGTPTIPILETTK